MEESGFTPKALRRYRIGTYSGARALFVGSGPQERAENLRKGVFG